MHYYIQRLSIDITADEAMLFLESMIAIAVIMCVILLVLRKKNERENAKKPVLTVGATLIDKQQIQPGQIPIGGIWVVFELENGDRVKLIADMRNSLMIGDTGTLTYQGNKILGFDRKR